jgi:hypothetical protein
MIKEQASLTEARSKTPRVAAVADILFSILLMLALVLLGLSLPYNPRETRQHSVLWVIGVLRAHLGDREDRSLAKRASRRASVVRKLREQRAMLTFG